MMAETTTIEKSFVINELLCYIQNNFASSTLAGLQTVISGFYTVGLEEITNAKSKLYEVVKQVYSSRDDLHVDDLPRFTTRRSGDNKRRLDAGDIIDLCSTLDTRTTNDIPQFVALDLSRIPPFQPDATDYCSLAASVEFLHGQMAEVMKKLSSHHTMFHIDVRPNTGTVADLTQPTPPPVAAYASSGVSHTSETSGSSLYAKAALVQSYAQQTK